MNEDSVNTGRRNFLIGATTAVGSAGVVGLAVPFVGSWNPSAKALAAGAPVKVDISKLSVGEILGPIPAWRDKPIFVVKRSDAMLEQLNSMNGRLADPDSQREQQPGSLRMVPAQLNQTCWFLLGSAPICHVHPNTVRLFSRKYSMRNG